MRAASLSYFGKEPSQIDLAQAFADRIIALKAGRVVFDGQPGALTPAVTEEIYGSTRKHDGAGMKPP